MFSTRITGFETCANLQLSSQKHKTMKQLLSSLFPFLETKEPIEVKTTPHIYKTHLAAIGIRKILSVCIKFKIFNIYLRRFTHLGYNRRKFGAKTDLFNDLRLIS